MLALILQFLGAILPRALGELSKRGGPRKELQDFASARGFEYKEQILQI